MDFRFVGEAIWLAARFKNNPNATGNAYAPFWRRFRTIFP